MLLICDLYPEFKRKRLFSAEGKFCQLSETFAFPCNPNKVKEGKP